MKVAILDDYQGVAREMADWDSLGEDTEVTIFRDTIADEDELVRRLEPFAVIGAMRERTPFPASLIGRLPNLRLLVTTGMKNASIDVAAANRRGITVCGTGSSAHSTAELAFALILALSRDLFTEAMSMRDGGWQVGLGRDVNGKTLGVIGLGRLGGAVAGMGQAFGMEVIAWSQNLTAERCAEMGVRQVSKQTLLAESDFVTIHLRLSDRTAGLIGADEIARMKRTTSLVNTSRAPIVDTGALIAALRTGRLRSAALDVYDVEPLSADSPLRRVPNLLLTPHVGYVTRETYEIFYPHTVEAIAAFMTGEPIRVISD